jgi:hypothetical protein
MRVALSNAEVFSEGEAQRLFSALMRHRSFAVAQRSSAELIFSALFQRYLVYRPYSLYQLLPISGI